MPGWRILNIEPGPHVDYVGNCSDLSMFTDNSIAEVYASHVLEHLSHHGEFESALREVFRVLEPRGRFSVAVPDMAVLADLFVHAGDNTGLKLGVINILFGGQASPYDYHKVAFDQEVLSHYLRQVGFGNIERVGSFDFLDDASRYQYAGREISLNLRATKLAGVQAAANSADSSVNTMSSCDVLPRPLMGPLFNIPEELVRDFSMQGSAPIFIQFRYETAGGILRWSKAYWDSLFPRIDRLLETGEQIAYSSDPHLVNMLKKYTPDSRKVVVIGSVHPVYEALVKRMGGDPATVEYRKIESDIPGLETFTVDEFKRANRIFDFALSISSIEHDGLGRYGDPIDPNGDLATMKTYKSYLKKGGLMFLSVPVGQDALCWNSHRIYGRYRLPLLFEGWRLVDSSGFSSSLFDFGTAGTDFREPVFVLENI